MAHRFPRILRALAVPLLVLAACDTGPPTRATAARLCQEEARQADGISGNIGVGGGSGGPSAGGRVTITSDILNPRNERDALASCIDRRLGGDNSAPRRPAVSLTLGGST